ncbi:MAG: pyridoxamine 5'-phosphate oxidase [Actinomycetota bacterium]|nr:pyridoxamine 5'-phosphate oxidase [Actinomycetota bacterium]
MNADEAARLRREYEIGGLDESKMAADPFGEFSAWLEGVVAAELAEPNTFVLATADADGRPSARAVLMKSFSEEGIVFYTNLGSHKSQDLKVNGFAAATFVWVPLHRQVRFAGPVEIVEAEIADEYFASRPRGAQIGSHASDQSLIVESRAALESRFEELAISFGDADIPRPDSWGGWRLKPETVEFWQGQVNRFHDRIRYRLTDAGWIKERLAP